MKILKYSDHNKSLQMAQDFLSIIGNDRINEADVKAYDSILKKTMDDLKINKDLILTFGTGMSAMFPLVEKLVANMSLNIDLNIQTVVLITIAGVTIAYIEEKKNIDIKKKEILEKDAKSMLEELKLRGVGNGIIKKVVKCVDSISNLFRILLKNKKHVINGLFDMLAYAALATPVINAIFYMVGKYNMNLETLPGNFLSLGFGVTTLAAKNGLNYLINYPEIFEDTLNFFFILILFL